MFVVKEKALRNRAHLVGTAGKLFRERGIDGVGVAEIAREAGLTHGALYAHFPSKSALAAEALSDGLARSRDALAVALPEADENRSRTVSEYLEYFLTPLRRDSPGMSCPMTASASEVGRHGTELSREFSNGYLAKAKIFETAFGDEATPAERRRMALTIVAAEIGAMAVARGVLKFDPKLADEVLEAVRVVMLKAAEEISHR